MGLALFLVDVITWVTVTASMDVISSAANISPEDCGTIGCHLPEGDDSLKSPQQVVLQVQAM